MATTTTNTAPKPVNVFKTETELRLLIAESLKYAGELGSERTYTDEGKAEIWARHLAENDRARRIHNARNAVHTASRGVKNIDRWIMGQALGERPAETDVATELRLARVLARHDEWTTGDVLEAVEPLLGSPLCAELVAELDARGQIDWETFTPSLLNLAPEVAEYRRASRQVAYGVDQLEQLLEQLEQALKVETVLGAKDGEAKVKQNRYSAVSDYVGGDKFTIAETGEFNVDVSNLANVTDVMARRMPSKYAKY